MKPHEKRSREGHGRDADEPTQVPPRGWKDVAARTREEMKSDNVGLMAAGVAFFGLLALIPALVAVVSVYGLVADPADIAEQVRDSLAAAPQEAQELLETQLTSISEGSPSSVSIGAIVGIVVALWSASSGMGNLISAINLAYDERETRGWLRRKGISLTLTLGAIVFVIVALGLIAVLPALLTKTGLGESARVAIGILRWPLLGVGLLLGLATLYRYAPDRENPRWAWASPGAIVAMVVWLIASVAFSIYTANFASYNETYGSLGAVVILMMWLYLSAYVVIVGAELNAELERQTKSDTTTGEPKAMGVRGAVAADTVGETAEELRASH